MSDPFCSCWYASAIIDEFIPGMSLPTTKCRKLMIKYKNSSKFQDVIFLILHVSRKYIFFLETGSSQIKITELTRMFY
jgi:hypothetical protein